MTFLSKILLTALAILLLELLRRGVFKIAGKNAQSIQSKLALKQVLTIVFSLLSLVVVFLIWFKRFDSFVTAMTLVAVGLVVVNKEVILNFVSSWIILWRNLFAVGDRIQIGEHIGDVVNKGVIYFTLLEVGNWASGDQHTGRILRIPNSLVLTTPIANYTKDFSYIWNEIPIPIPAGSDWDTVRSALLEIIEAYNAEEGIDYREVLEDIREKFIIYKRLAPRVYVSAERERLLLTLRYLCEPHKRRESENFIWERLLPALDGLGLTLG